MPLRGIRAWMGFDEPMQLNERMPPRGIPTGFGPSVTTNGPCHGAVIHA